MLKSQILIRQLHLSITPFYTYSHEISHNQYSQRVDLDHFVAKSLTCSMYVGYYKATYTKFKVTETMNQTYMLSLKIFYFTYKVIGLTLIIL